MLKNSETESRKRAHSHPHTEVHELRLKLHTSIVYGAPKHGGVLFHFYYVLLQVKAV